MSVCVCVGLSDGGVLVESVSLSYLNLQHNFTASECQGGRLKLFNLGVFHVGQVVLPRGEAIEHKLHLGGDRRPDVQAFKRQSDADDGQLIFILRAGLDTLNTNHRIKNYPLPQCCEINMSMILILTLNMNSYERVTLRSLILKRDYGASLLRLH